MTFWNSTPTIFRVCSNNFQKYSEETQKKYRRTRIVAGITLYIIGIWIQLLLRTSVVRWLVLFFLFFSVRYSNQVRFYVYVLELLLIWVFHIHFLKQFNWFVCFCTPSFPNSNWNDYVQVIVGHSKCVLLSLLMKGNWLKCSNIQNLCAMNLIENST